MIPKPSRRWWIRAVLYSGIAIAGGVGYLSSKRLERVRADIPLAGLPKELEGLRVGVLSDFHAGAFATKEDKPRREDGERGESRPHIAARGLRGWRIQP
jgi:predicted MPP superfamily phosphohydrolase